MIGTGGLVPPRLQNSLDHLVMVSAGEEDGGPFQKVHQVRSVRVVEFVVAVHIACKKVHKVGKEDDSMQV